MGGPRSSSPLYLRLCLQTPMAMIVRPDEDEREGNIRYGACDDLIYGIIRYITLAHKNENVAIDFHEYNWVSRVLSLYTYIYIHVFPLSTIFFARSLPRLRYTFPTENTMTTRRTRHGITCTVYGLLTTANVSVPTPTPTLSKFSIFFLR